MMDAAGRATVISLLERYIGLKQGVRYNTRVGYNFVLNLVRQEDFGYRQIGSIKVSDAQQWIIKLHNDGKGYSTITSVRGVSSPPFKWRITRILSAEILSTSNWWMSFPTIQRSAGP